jgi:hypothetical protein
MSLKSKISNLKEKANKYDRLNINYIELQHKYDNLFNQNSELEKMYLTLEEENKENKQNKENQQNQQNDKDIIIRNLEIYISDINNNYHIFQNYYNNMCNILNTTKYNENQLNLILNDKQNEINLLKQNLENINKNIITNNEYTSLLTGYYKKEQIMNAKQQNIMKEITELQKENESLQNENENMQDKISYLIGNIDDLKGNCLIIEKDTEIKRLHIEISNLELYIEQKEDIISDLIDTDYSKELQKKQKECDVIFNKYKLLEKKYKSMFQMYNIENTKRTNFENNNLILEETIKQKTQEITILNKEIDEFKQIVNLSSEEEEDDDDEEEDDEEDDDDEEEDDEEEEDDDEKDKNFENISSEDNDWYLLSEKIEIIVM